MFPYITYYIFVDDYEYLQSRLYFPDVLTKEKSAKACSLQYIIAKRGNEPDFYFKLMMSVYYIKALQLHIKDFQKDYYFVNKNV